jgi:hypothetical protein
MWWSARGLEPGRHSVEYRFTKALYPRGAEPETAPAVWSTEDTFKAEVQVVGPEAPEELKLPDDPSHADAIRQAVVLKGACYGDMRLRKRKGLQVVFEIAGDLPVPIAFEVVARFGGREIVLGSLEHGPRPRRAMPPGVPYDLVDRVADQSRAEEVKILAPVDDLRAAQVTLILRTSCRCRSFLDPRSPGQVAGGTCFEVWKGELRYDPVEVQKVSTLR